MIFLLVFVYVFGGTLGAGLVGAGLGGGGLGEAGRAVYVNYVTPGIVLITVAGAATATAVSVATDMTEGIVARFRTMAISRASILTGHVIASMISTLLSMAVVIGMALLVGFRPAAGPAGWLAVTGLLALFVLAVTWLSVALGCSAICGRSGGSTGIPSARRPAIGPLVGPETLADSLGCSPARRCQFLRAGNRFSCHARHIAVNPRLNG